MKKNLHVMCGGNALENNFSLERINIPVNPSTPCCHSFVISNQSVHIFLHLFAFLNEIPPELANTQFYNFIFKKNQNHIKQSIICIYIYVKFEVDIRLGTSSMSPPMPRIENEEIHSSPCIPTSN